MATMVGMSEEVANDHARIAKRKLLDGETFGLAGFRLTGYTLSMLVHSCYVDDGATNNFELLILERQCFDVFR